MSILNETLQQREAKIGKVLDYITQTRHLFEKFGSTELKAIHDSFEPLIEGLKSDKVRIVVIGEFSRGKSRLVNALLGIDLLPSAKEATTAINTFLQSPPPERANQKYIQLNFIDPNTPSEELKWTDNDVLKKWGTELDVDNKHGRSELQSIYVYAPHELLDKGLVVIDTPGLESVVAHHEDITRKAIASSHIAIWVQSVEQLGGNSREWEFLKETVRQHFRKFLTVVNMWDQVLDPEDEHDRTKPEAQRAEEKLNKVRENFRRYLSDLPAEELDEMTNSRHLMGVSAKWAIEKNGENRHRSGINHLVQRIADLCSSGEAEEEIFYKPLQQLSAIQKTLAAALEDEIHVLNDERSIKEQQNELELLEQEIKNQELEQKQTEKEFRDEHYRASQIIAKRINENLVMPLKTLKDEIEIVLTKDYIKREVEAGRKNVSLPQNMQDKFKKVTESVSEEWIQQKNSLETSLNDLKADYIEAMQQHSVKLQETLGGFNIEIPDIKIDLNLDLSGLVTFQKKKMDLEQRLIESEHEAEKFELELAQLSVDDPRVRSAQAAFQRARQDLIDLGGQPAPHSYNAREKVSDGGMYSNPEYATVVRYDDSNVKAYQQEKSQLKSIAEEREKMLEQYMQEEAQRNQQRQTVEVLRRKAEQRLAQYEKALKQQESELKKEQEHIVTETVQHLKKSTLGELNKRINYLEKNAGKMVETVFDDQLKELLRCVEEQYMQPLRAKQAKREEVLQLFEQGKAKIDHRKMELAQAKMELRDVMEFTSKALNG
jgi:predicted acylesterase/phospholipase RssA